MKNVESESWKLKYLSDYACYGVGLVDKRKDFQDEADPTEMKKENLQDFQDCAQREGKVESWKLKVLSDYAKRRDFQDEADPTEMRERGFTGFPGLRAAGEGEN